MSTRGTFAAAALLIAASCAHRTATPPKESNAATSALSHKERQCLARANAERALPKDPPASIEAAQLLIRHRELDRPSGATRSRGQACLRALAALEALQGGADWGAVVSEYSDSGKATAGDLGTIHPDEVTPAFAQAAFSLSSNELSYVVEADRGFHIILRQ